MGAPWGLHRASAVQIPAWCAACTLLTCWSHTGGVEAWFHANTHHFAWLPFAHLCAKMVGDELCMSHGLLTPSEPPSLPLFFLSLNTQGRLVFSAWISPGFRRRQSCCSPCSLRCATSSATIHSPKVSHPRAPPAIIACTHGMSFFKQLRASPAHFLPCLHRGNQLNYSSWCVINFLNFF